MKDQALYYSVGALLYCPANNESIVNSIINQKFGSQFSLALCLEDTIHDDFVLKAEDILVNSLTSIQEARNSKDFFLPKIFIRVRNAEQIVRLYQKLSNCLDILTGFIIPKFSLETVDNYIQTIITINETSKKPVYVMPIYENKCIIDLRKRYEILYAIKDKLKSIEELVLNIRVGGNDLCHAFGFRRHDTESIHKIRPVSDIFTDIITVYGRDYVVSGPVWEYYNGDNWKTGLMQELNDDRLCGFIGKTVIHPNQIAVVNECYKVLQSDLDDAKAILDWDQTSHSMVSGNGNKQRMNEFKTHSNWAMQTILMAQAFGTK